MKKESEDAFWPDKALTNGELAERIGVSPHWVTRNVPERLFIGNKIHLHEYYRWRMNEQERLAEQAGRSQPLPTQPEVGAREHGLDSRWKHIEDRLHGA